jgi:hypothetical protein
MITPFLRMSWLPRLAVVVLLVALCGCGRTATVKGKVTYQGKPVTYGSVVIVSTDKTARSGVIETDGSYTVEKVTPGEVKIAVLSHDPRTGRSHAGDKEAKKTPRNDKSEKSAPGGWFPLPTKYEDPTKSGQSCLISPGKNLYDIDLK